MYQWVACYFFVLCSHWVSLLWSDRSFSLSCSSSAYSRGPSSCGLLPMGFALFVFLWGGVGWGGPWKSWMSSWVFVLLDSCTGAPWLGLYWALLVIGRVLVASGYDLSQGLWWLGTGRPSSCWFSRSRGWPPIPRALVCDELIICWSPMELASSVDIYLFGFVEGLGFSSLHSSAQGRHMNPKLFSLQSCRLLILIQLRWWAVSQALHSTESTPVVWAGQCGQVEINRSSLSIQGDVWRSNQWCMVSAICLFMLRRKPLDRSAFLIRVCRMGRCESMKIVASRPLTRRVDVIWYRFMWLQVFSWGRLRLWAWNPGSLRDWAHVMRTRPYCQQCLTGLRPLSGVYACPWQSCWGLQRGLRRPLFHPPSRGPALETLVTSCGRVGWGVGGWVGGGGGGGGGWGGGGVKFSMR